MHRTVLVTGGRAGIGLATARRFAAAGDTVIITGRSAEELARVATDLGARAIACDHADPAQVEALSEALPERVDVLVNNAGGNTDFTQDAGAGLSGLAGSWRANLQANLLSAVLTTTAVGPRLVAGGAVVHIGSIAADKGAGAYGAAKAGLASWNIDLAGELGARDITSNVVAPGYIAETGFFHGRLSDARRKALIDATDTKRAGVPEDIAETIYFLASPGGHHITGQLINVNGGAMPTR